MAAVGRLLIRIGSDTGGLRRGGKQAEGVVNNLGKRAATVTRRLGKLGGAAATAGTALGVALTRSGLNAVDSQAKLARQLGTTQAQLSGLTKAASEAGIEQGQLESNIQALNKRLGEAQQGSGQAKDALDQLGLSADTLANMPLNTRLDAIGAAINELPTPTERAAVAADLFSRSGLDMINLFEGGAGKIEAATNRMREFGVAVSEVEAAQIESANDAMADIGSVIQGVSNQLAAELSPILDGVARLFTSAASESDGFENVIANLVDNAVSGLGHMMDFVHRLKLAFALVRHGVIELDAGIQIMAIETFNAIVSGPTAAINKLIEAANRVPHVNIDPLELPDVVGRGEKQIAGLRGYIRRQRDELSQLFDQPLPSEGLEEWVRTQREQSEYAAQQLVADRNAERQATLESQRALAEQSGQMSEAERESEAQIRRQNLERLRNYLATEREAEVMAHQERMEWLNQARENELVTEAEYRRMKEEAERKHQASLTKIAEDGMTERQKFNAKSMMAQTSQVADSLQSMTASVARENKAMFALNKAAGITNAIINTYQGVTKSLSAYPMPLAGAMAAAHLAAGMAQVQQIKSQSFGGGGTAAGGSASLTNGSAAAAQNAPAPPTQESREQTFTVRGLSSGDLFTGETMRELLENIEEASEDGRTRIRVM